MYHLSDIWQSFLSAVIRFLDARFYPKTDPMLDMLRLELERALVEKSKMLDLISNLTSKTATVTESDVEMPAAIGKPHWTVLARQREAESRKVRETMEQEYKASQQAGKTLQTVADIEAELETM